MGRKGPRSSASSSSAAASVGGAAPTFTSFAAATAAVLEEIPLKATFSEWDVVALQTLKAASKKDANTRVRALADLNSHLTSIPGDRPDDLGVPFINSWGFQFPALAADPIPLVRVSAVEAMARVVVTFTNLTQPILRNVLPHWTACLGDSASAVVSSTKQSLNLAFPSSAVRFKLVGLGADALLEYCNSAAEALRTTGDEDQIRRILAVAKWTIDTSQSLQYMLPFVDEDLLLRLGTGVKVSGKGLGPIASSRAACIFAADSIVPLLTHKNEKSLNLSRASRIADLALASICAGESAGWDLLLTLLSSGWHGAFGTWQRAKNAFKKSLSGSASAASCAALLPLLTLLPKSSLVSVDIATFVLDLLRSELFPNADNIPAQTSTATQSPAKPIKSLSVACTMDMLPAYLECLSFACKTGADRWCTDSRKTELSVYAFSHVAPAVGGYLTGTLLPPRLPATGCVTAPRRSERPPAEPQRFEALPRLFADSLLALDSADKLAVTQIVADAALPIRAGSPEISRRLVAVIEYVNNGDSDLAVTFLRYIIPSLISDTAAEEDVQFAHLRVLADISKVLVRIPEAPGAGFDDLIKFALQQSNCHARKDVGDCVGCVLSWVAVSGGNTMCQTVLRAVLDLAARSFENGIVILGAVLHSHKGRLQRSAEKSNGVELSNSSPCYSGDDLDGFIANCASRLISRELSTNVRADLADLVETAVDRFGAATISCETRCRVIEATYKWILHLNEIDNARRLISSLLTREAGNFECFDALGHLVAVYVANAYFSDADIIDDDISVVSSFLSGIQVAEHAHLIDQVLHQVSDRLARSSSVFADAEILGRRWVRVVAALNCSPDVRTVHAGAVGTISSRLRDISWSSLRNLKSQDVVDAFASSIVVGVGPKSMFCDFSGAVQAHTFILEFGRISHLTDIGRDRQASAEKQVLLDFLEQHGTDAIPAIARVAVELVSEITENDEGNSSDPVSQIGSQNVSRSLTRDLLMTVLDLTVQTDRRLNHNAESNDSALQENRNWLSVNSAAKAMQGLDVASPDIVKVCCEASQGHALPALREVLVRAVKVIRSDSETAPAGYAMGVLTAALNPVRIVLSSLDDGCETLHSTFEGPDWLVEQVGLALRAIRRSRESYALTNAMGNRAFGVLLVARSIQCGFELSEDDWRYWSLATLDALREAQLLDPNDTGPNVIADVAAMAELAAAMATLQCKTGFKVGASVEEIAHHGAWAAANLMASAAPQSLHPFCDLVLIAAKLGVLNFNDTDHVIPPSRIYELMPLMENCDAVVRRASFILVGTTGNWALPKVVEESLPSEGFRDEDSENSTIACIIPSPIRKALEWSQEGESLEGSHSEATYTELGFFLSWLLFFHLIQGQGRNQASSGLEDRSFRRVGVTFLRTRADLFADLFSRCVNVVIDGTRNEKTSAAEGAIASLENSLMDFIGVDDNASDVATLVGRYAGATLAHALQKMPALSRRHFAENVEHGLALQIEDFVKRRVSPFLIAEEISKVRAWSGEAGAGGMGGEGELNARGSLAGREVWATYTLSEVTLQVVLRIPEAFPLKTVQVDDSEANRCVGMGKSMWRNTLVGMNILLQFKDGSLAEAVELWRCNLGKTFQGVEECPICYSVLHLVAGTLPKMQCRTCKNLFHSECLCKWFRTSSSSACPMCRSAF
jgi:FANCL C-terminal domain